NPDRPCSDVPPAMNRRNFVLYSGVVRPRFYLKAPVAIRKRTELPDSLRMTRSSQPSQPSITQFINDIGNNFSAPRHRSGRDQRLRIVRQIIQQGVAAIRIQLAKNVIDQK